MLPSTGYFKGINCPFYDSGLCERPYCHFRHVKKEPQNTNSDNIESGAILQKLVSAAVQRVLQQSEPTSTASSSKSEVTTTQSGACLNAVQIAPKATYNPTPIAELNKLINSDIEVSDEVSEQKKRHIPVPYTPRKPVSTPIKRIIESEESSKPFIYIPPAKYTPGGTETAPVDQYTPKGSIESNSKYLPGSEVELQEYAPKETQTNLTSKLNYIPSGKNGGNRKKILEYKPAKVSAKSEVPSVTYQPTPRSLVPCFSSDEDEPVNKKKKLSSDLNGLDDFGPEFDILDQILNEEKSDHETKNFIKKQVIKTNLDEKECTRSTKDAVQSSKENTKSEEKSKFDKKERSKDDKHKNNRNDKHKSTDKKKSSHKSHHRDKSKEDHIHKESSDKKSNSSSKRDSTKKVSKDKTKSNDKKDSDKNSTSKHSIRENKKENLEKNDRHKSHKNLSKHKSSHKNSKDKHSSSKRIKCNDDHNAEELIENEVLSESDEEAIALECKKIFEEYVPTEKPVKNDEPVEEIVENEYVPGKQRISRTTDKNIKTIPRAALKPDYKVSAAQAMAERLSKIKEYHASKNFLNSNMDNSVIKPDVSKSLTNSSTNAKIRIAHVPYVSTLLNAKKGISPNVNEVKNVPSTSTTIIQSNKKGVQRVAHIPNEKFIDRPGVLEPLASKIPPNIRSTYLNMMIDECLKIYLSATDAYARAQYEELATSKKCSSVQIYKNSAVLAVSRLRKELQECKGVKKSGMDCSTLQKNSTVSVSKSNESGSWSIENKKQSDNTLEFKGSKFYSNIQKWILTEDQLQENGFPRAHPNGEKGRAIIYSQRKQIPPKGFIRTCCRCKKNFTVDKKGFAVIKEDCIYHPNNKYRMRGEIKYQCCSQDGTSDGCCTAPTHVYEYVDYENLKGFVRTLPPEDIMNDYGVYSLDCEMCYTTQGLDLTRITVIDSSCKVVYETLIKPLHPIIDYNTRYSGITEEQMRKVKTTLLEVQATLLSMFNSKTILIGHSLESDFKALKLIHDTVIDTSVLFPHKMGPPYKRALRNLSSELLRKIIQNNIEGHDSAEDATVCMELIHYKLKEFLKTR